MIVVGLVLLLVGMPLLIVIFVSAIVEGFSEYKVSVLIPLLMLVVGIGCIVYDKGSPVETVLEKTFISNQLNDITFEEVMLIKVYTEKPTRLFAISNTRTNYEVEAYKDKEEE